MDQQHENPTRTFYDRISGVYDLISDAGEHECRIKGLELLDVQGGEQVLEIGYGTGHALLELAQAVGDAGKVHGVDISQGMYEVAGDRLAKAGLTDRVDLQVHEAPPLPYDDQLFDAVTMSFTLELFPEEVIPCVLAECRRVLKPSGRLGVVSMALPAEDERESFLEKTYKWMHHHFPHIVDCRPIDVHGVVTEAGFAVQREEELHILSLPVVALVAS